jgi:hypothetical protein
MSNTTVDPNAAQQTLFTEVYLPAFVEKCAEHGLKLQDESSLQSALESVAMLKTAEAGSQSGLAEAAAADLRSTFGVPQPAETKADEDSKKQAAETAKNEKIRGAIDALIAAGQKAQS